MIAAGLLATVCLASVLADCSMLGRSCRLDDGYNKADGKLILSWLERPDWFITVIAWWLSQQPYVDFILFIFFLNLLIKSCICNKQGSVGARMQARVCSLVQEPLWDVKSVLIPFHWKAWSRSSAGLGLLCHTHEDSDLVQEECCVW